MTNPMRPGTGRETPGLPTPPTGWPIGSYGTYAEAQKAVDYLSDENFSVQDVTIVGVDLMQVERVLGRLTWGKVIGGGIVSGAWLGLFFGLLVSLVVTGNAIVPLLFGLVGGIVFGVISTSIPYAATKGQRDFASTMQLVAGRYDVICDPKSAEKARDLLARTSI
ncbi:MULTISPECIES: general stress protein [Williamsia]|uniref:Membrane protein n=1 Tax=Williamsia phyllosphaerae TaxID=885042 RepID=A0ABQ1V0Q0_9NOCA|nr:MULTISPECIES: general stress protein [Williamsia]MBJ7290318.1 magnesium transporter [Williamsia sp.]GGF31071.1 membrane protein [Williamsia phyllosphaerae]